MSLRGKAVAVTVIAVAAGMASGHHGKPLSATLTDVHLAGNFSTVRWERAFLREAGLPRTRCNRNFVLAWEQAEGTYGEYDNPLDTTLREARSQSVNSVGVQSYPSLTEGLHATVVTLYNGYYSAIVAAMRAGNDAQAAADAVASSPWGTAPFSASC